MALRFKKGLTKQELNFASFVMFIANKNKELAALRDGYNFIQIQTAGEWQCCQFLVDMPKNFKRNNTYSRKNHNF